MNNKTVATNPTAFGEPGDLSPEAESLDLAMQEIEDRAFSKTDVLSEILDRPESSYLRHWGINE